MTITIDAYTGTWQAALRPRQTPPRIGAHVRISEAADAREYDDFSRAMREAGRGLDFVRWMPRAKLNVYRITARGDE